MDKERRKYPLGQYLYQWCAFHIGSCLRQFTFFCGKTNQLQHCLDRNVFRLLGFELFSIAEESKQIVSNGAKPAKRNSLREKEEEVSDSAGMC